MLCKNCGEEIKFRTDRPDRIYCCNKCRMKDLKVQVPCDECGKIIDVLKSQLKYSIFHFCSKECQNKSKKFAEYRGKQVKNSEKYQKARENQNRIYVKGIHNSPSTEFKKGWQHTKRGKEIIKKRAKSLKQGISKPEKFLIELIKAKNLPFNFVGDGQFIVDTKLPDFIYTKKGNKIIEVFSDYWHREDIVKYWHQTEEGTKKYYEERGYNVLVLWEKELKKEKIPNILKKIQKFLDGTLEFKNISSQTYKEFNEFCEQEFDGNGGLCFKSVWDNFKLWQMFFQNMDMKLDNILGRLSQIEQKEQSSDEKCFIKALSGRTISGGKK